MSAATTKMSGAPILYQEVRLSPTPYSPSSTLHVETTGSSRTQLVRAGSKRPFDAISSFDDETFTRKHLATEGSVFFRSKARSPRSFLWRILDDRRLLEIQSVDLVHDRRHDRGDSGLTFHIALPARILRDGVAFADPQETDALECFVLTEGKELFTVTLKHSLLTREIAPANFDASTIVKKYTSTSLSVRHPYRLVATSSLELLVSLSDGCMLHLERKANESGARWRETQFSAGGWTGSLRVRGIFSNRQSIRHGDLDLDPTAVAAMVKSPGGKFIWTVSLDHWLQAWNVKSGKIVFRGDLLGEGTARDAHQKQQQYIIGPEQHALLQVVTRSASAGGQDVVRMDEGGIYYLAVHSPRDHQFKFYLIKEKFSSAEGDWPLGEDQRPSVKLIPPVDELLNTSVWHLDQFFVRAGADWEEIQLWIRTRTGALCKTFMITLSLLGAKEASDAKHGEQWQKGWVVVDAGSQTPDELKHVVGYPGGLQAASDSAIAPNTRWLHFLLYNGRFSVSSLETALYGYRKGRGLSTTSSGRLKGKSQPLEQRLTEAVTSKILLRRRANDQPDYDRYQQEVQSQWMTYYSLLLDLHGRRQEPIGFALDFEEGLPWTVCADGVAPIRACSGVELRTMNTHLLSGGAERRVEPSVYDQIYPDEMHGHDISNESATLSRVVIAASDFRKSFSANAQYILAVAAERDALTDPNDTQPGRVLSVYDRCGFDTEVTDEAFDSLTTAMESVGGLGSITDSDFLGIWDWIQAEGDVSGFDSGALLDRYGVELLVQVAQETLQRAHARLLDMLALIAFMAGGVEASELDSDFNPDQAYDAILWPLRKVQLLLWLAEHTREETLHRRKTQQPDEHERETRTVTLLEDFFVGDWRPLIPEDAPGKGLSEHLTLWCNRWTWGLEVEGEAQWTEVTANILANLIKHEERELAVDFERFVTDHEFSRYVKARLHVMTGDYDVASVEFRDAAVDMSATTNIASTDKYHLLSPDELNQFGCGLAAYFQHVAGIFEKIKVYSYVAHFAKLALQGLENSMPSFSRSLAALDRKRREANASDLESYDNALQEIKLLQWKEVKDEILNRMFNAYVQTGRFEEAYETLEQIETEPIQRSNMKTLLAGCVQQDAVSTLLRLPIRADLAREADQALLGMAKKELEKGTTHAPPTRRSSAYQTLYAFRTQRADFRGAAEILHERLERLRTTPGTGDPEDETILEAYVLLINTLACCGEEDAWLLADPIPGVGGGVNGREGGRGKRKLVTLADVRREYTTELDRRSDVLHGRFPMVNGGGEEMDVL